MVNRIPADSGKSVNNQAAGAVNKIATTRPSLTRACAVARPSCVPASWQVKDENAYALQERHEREAARHGTAALGHCYALRQ
jgi:hypothetical protein